MDDKDKGTLDVKHEPDTPPLPLSIVGLEPNSRPINDVTFDLHVIGLGFNHNSMITFDRNNRPTTYVSDTDVFTTINPATAQYEGVYTVTVKDGAIESNELPFTFTAPVTAEEKDKEAKLKVGPKESSIFPTPKPAPTFPPPKHVPPAPTFPPPKENNTHPKK